LELLAGAAMIKKLKGN